MIRRFTSGQFVPANAGAKAKNPVGSTLFSTPMVALLRCPGHKILRTCCHESARKRLMARAEGGGVDFDPIKTLGIVEEDLAFQPVPNVGAIGQGRNGIRELTVPVRIIRRE